MRTMTRLALLVFWLVLPRPTAAQQLRGEGTYPRYGYGFSAWQLTRWNGIEFRIKCEGESIRGSSTGPIRWMVEFRNRSSEVAHFDYLIGPPGPKPVATSGRADLKPGKSLSRLSTVSTTRCDEGLLTLVQNVRFGADINGSPYARPDTPLDES